MLFNSGHFLLFFPVVTTLFFVAPHRARWLLLLAASAYFYMAFVPVYILILLFTILVDYAAGLLIAGAGGRARRLFLLASLAANLGVLAVFKYATFATANLQALGHAVGAFTVPVVQLVLPVGLSFHTFQAMSYTIEVYRGRVPPERHLGLFALYVLFYPQLVAGPIERPYNLLPQLHLRHQFDYGRVTDGLQRMAWGLFKKMVIADRLAVVVDQVYGAPELHAGFALLLATLFFAFQIYCDFSGYSDIALGAASVMGIRLMENFRQPYWSTSIAEFWRRWHISLSSWFRDYVYVPLGGNRVDRPRWLLNLLLVFVLSGLWHGAGWTFVAWGAVHGLGVIAYHLTAAPRAWLGARLPGAGPAALRRGAATVATFAFVCLTWVLFRAASLADAAHIYARMFRDLDLGAPLAGLPRGEVLLSFAGIGLLLGYELVEQRVAIRPALARQPAWMRWSFYYALLLAIVLGGKLTERSFIYFQF
jgi:alginate O-acetyltransferase complex protein AlgI